VSETADAIVIGAGIIGASIAWRLAQRGLQVTLIDAGQAGREASWAGAGMLAPGGEVTEQTDWSAFALHSHSLYSGFVAELEQETGCKIDYQTNGAIEIATNENEWAEVRARAEKQRSLGIESHDLDGAEVRPFSPLACGALFYPGDAVVDPRDVMRALLAACRSRHVRVLELTAALGICSAPGSIAVETKSGPLTAAVAVLAAGAWSGAIPFTSSGATQALPGSFPVRGHLIGYRPVGSVVCRTILRNSDTYILQRSNGLIVAGTSTENVGFDRRIDPEIVADISHRAEALWPALEQAGPPEAWLGFRPRADAHQPRIGRFADSNLWLAYGHYRNGILLAPATAERVSEEIIGH
jgi:glycine oxidase